MALTLSLGLFGQHFHYNHDNRKAGFNIEENKSDQILVGYSLTDFDISAIEAKDELLDLVSLPGNFLPSEAGNPNLPSQSCFIAIPEGAEISFTISNEKRETIKGKNIAPAMNIPFDTQDAKQEYIKNEKVYEKNALYPASPVVVSEVMNVRGVSMVQIGITPFQYNPVTKELQVITSMDIALELDGAKGVIADDRLRSPWFEPILQDMLANYESLPAMKKVPRNSKSNTGYEYLIVIPNDPAWLPYAQQIQEFRNQQGILTGIVTLDEIGGNTPATIEAYIDNAYNNWDIPPVAVLLMADYGSDATNSITSYEYSHPYSGTYITDNTYADVTGNSLPDIIFARMAAENTTQLQVMVSKVIEYETTPPTDASVYTSPVTALGWQTERWFQICSEVIGGYMQTLGKTPNRINEIYSGTPGTTWSTATNTSTVVDYFGPNGLGYIPATPEELGNWSGGNATMVTNAINNGTFMVVHRDHGGETLWGEPSYSTSHINTLTNDVMPFVFSLNCLTGKFNRSGECFAEAFHRHTYNGNNSGALGLVAASQVSYSFVNDTYAWGMFDNFFPDFMPDYGMTEVPERGLLPAFGSASGKYFLQQSNWPYNSYNKEITYNLFHHHGDAFSVVYSEVPQTLAVTHNTSMLSSASSFDVIAPEGSLIGLSVNGEMIGSAYSEGGSTSIAIDPQSPQDVMMVTVTKQNYYRYQATVTIEAPAGACVMYDNHSINDIAFNANGVAEYGEVVNINIMVGNIGDADATDVALALQTTDTCVSVAQGNAIAGTVPAGAVVTVNDAFTISISESTPDGHTAAFVMTATDGAGNAWTSNFNVEIFAGELTVLSWTIVDEGGDGTLDPGETATLNVNAQNIGGAEAENVIAAISSTDQYLTINTTAPQSLGSLAAGTTGLASFEIVAATNTPAGHEAQININLAADKGLLANDVASVYIDKIPALVIDLDNLPSSGTTIQTTIQGLGVNAQYSTSIPSDLNLYENIFLCLGIYPDNHTLTNDEGQAFADFLNNGGNLYMEGGDTWAYDQPTPVHAMFNITGLSDGNSDLNSIEGFDGTMTADMTFVYSGANSYIDQIEAASTGVEILNNPLASYTCAVSNESTNYKTIGQSFEFGGLTENAATPEELMEEYLIFFGLATGGTPAIPPQISVQPGSITTTVPQCSNETHTITIVNSGEQTLICTINQSSEEWLFIDGAAEINVVGCSSNTFDITLSSENLDEGMYTSSIIISCNDPETPQVNIPVEMNVYNPIVCPAPMVVCENDLPFPLGGATPEGGYYHGTYVSNDLFYPSEAGPGEHIIYYSLYPNASSCASTNSFTITVNAAPVVIVPADMAMCGDVLEPVTLTGATPEGGEYSGPGVTNAIFDPAVAGYGVHEITYTYTDSVSGCYDFDIFTISVDSLQPVTCPSRIHVCEFDPEFTLTGGSPEVGVYVYAGDTITTFDPYAMGPGNYRIKYIYDGIGDCGGSCRFVITVHTSPTVPQNFTADNVDEMYVDLSWDAASYIKKYYLYYKETTATDWSMIILNKSLTTFTLENLEPGTNYEAMIQGMNKYCLSDMSDTISFTTLEMPSYCTTGSLDSSNEWIDYVKFSRLPHYSGDDGGYIDNTSIGWGKLYAGSSSKVRFSAGRTGAKRDFHWGIWIDFDRDGVFDENEQIVNTVSNKTSTRKQTFFIPNDAHIGITRARVTMKYGGEPGACELYDRGETEDYWVKIFTPKNASSGGDFILKDEIEEDDVPAESLIIVPNPAADYVLIHYGTMVSNADLQIFNATGNLVYNASVSGIEYPMNASTFSPGVYMVILTTGTNRITGKLVVK